MVISNKLNGWGALLDQVKPPSVAVSVGESGASRVPLVPLVPLVPWVPLVPLVPLVPVKGKPLRK